MHTLYDPRQNHIIAALPAADFGRLFQHLELAPMLLGQVLGESGGQMHHVYFPTTAIVSSHYVLADGASAEFAVIGNEGVVGTSVFMSGEATQSRSVVHGAGYAYRIKKKVMLDEFNRAGPMQRLLLRHTQSVLTQIAQTAVCNRHHSIDQQLCRCLLMRLDRSTSGELVLTQELIAGVLGVRREGVTEAAGRLQKAGLIEYRRGHITVLDRVGMEARVCECYAVVKAESDRLLNGVRAWPPTPCHLGRATASGRHSCSSVSPITPAEYCSPACPSGPS
jgi:CRP-like cAMP-binding protein